MNCFETIMVYIQGEDDNVADYYCYFKYKDLEEYWSTRTNFEEHTLCN